MAEQPAPPRVSRTLQYPATIGQPEPLIVSLRIGVARVFALGNHLTLLRPTGTTKPFITQLEEIVDAVDPKAGFELSPGARMLQELYGPMTDQALSPNFQMHLRSVLVAASALEKLGRERYQAAVGKKGK